ncbi:MAG: hypothetical protein C4521_01275 [Actinobacteria bacterium]|nr:MAG: hypothetical protein C4521_01275 [Actinomycetota bacterium]
MSDKPDGAAKPEKKKKVTPEQIQAKVEEIQGRVRKDITSNEALIAVGVVLAIGVLTSLSYWLGRRSSR